MHAATFRSASQEKDGNIRRVKTKSYCFKEKNVYNHIKLLSSHNTYEQSDILPHGTIMHIQNTSSTQTTALNEDNTTERNKKA